MATAETAVTSVSKVLSGTLSCQLFSICFWFLPYYSLTPMLSPDDKGQKLPLKQCMDVVFSGGPGIYSRKIDDNLISWLNINSFLRTIKRTKIDY